MAKKPHIPSEDLSSDDEDFFTFAEEVESQGWIRRAMGTGAHVIAEVTGISNLIKTSRAQEFAEDPEDDDNYSPIRDDTNALKYIPTYKPNEVQAPQNKSMQFNDSIESGYTNFNNVAKDFYSQAQSEMKVQRKRKKSEHTFINLLLKVLVLVTLGLVAVAGYKKFEAWSQTSQSVTAKLLRDKLNKPNPKKSPDKSNDQSQ